MSNIRDLQKLRGIKNQSAFSQTVYNQYLNPQKRKSKYDNILERPPILTTRSPRKQHKQSEQSCKSPTRLPIHRRGASFGPILLQEDKYSPINQNQRSSIYSISLKLNEIKGKESFLHEFPSTERKQRDNCLQLTELAFSRKRSGRQLSPTKSLEMSKKMLTILYPIGKGGFGKVWKVQLKKSKLVYAMKQMSKAKIINKKSVRSVVDQRQFLTKLYHPFLINMTYAFQDRENLYLILEYLDGGDLRYHLGNKRFFNQKETKFFISNLIIGLEYLHKNKIIHRDIKPQNLVLDSEGYLRITDLGVSREFKQGNSTDTSGTPGYMAPEVMCRKDHSFAVDYFALGVITYEFMLGRRPYHGRDRKQIKQAMLAKQAQVRIDDLPYKWSPHAIDFINRLLLRNPNARLGASGIEQIKEHPWLQDIQWDRILKKKFKAPYRPISIDEDYQSYKQQISQDTVVQNEEEILLMLRNNESQSLFEGYYFERQDEGYDKKSTSHTTNYTQENLKRK